MIEKPYNQIHPALQFLIFVAVFAGVFLVGNLLGVGAVIALYGTKTLMGVSALNVTSPHFVNALWILQITGTTLPIFAAPIYFSYVIVKDTPDYIKPNISFPLGLLFLVIPIMLLALPTIELLSNVNQKMQLPHFLNSLQKWMEDSEKGTQKAIDVFLQMNTIWDMILDLLFIGLLTAIVEEFMFRGVLQTIFFRWTKSMHAAIWITAILFSAFHMQFFGFLPRLFLGALFGYFVAWTGSIWPAISAHFIFNGTQVILSYLYKNKVAKINPDDQHLFSMGGYIFSLVIMLFLLFLYRKVSLEKKTSLTDHRPQPD